MFKRILVPVDGSSASLAGLRTAVKVAHIHRARVRLVHLANEVPPPRGDTGLSVSELYDQMRKRGHQLLERHARIFRARGIKCESALYVALAGRASDVIVKEAGRWRADLVAMGTHGRRGIRRLALGSDAEQVTRASRIPVLLTRAKGR